MKSLLRLSVFSVSAFFGLPFVQRVPTRTVRFYALYSKSSSSINAPEEHNTVSKHPADDLVGIDNLSIIETTIGYRFHQRHLLATAFIHPSMINVPLTPSSLISNRRLEYLGDAVLDLVIAHYLYTSPALQLADEGRLTQLKGQIVQGSTCARLMQQLSVGRFLRLGGGQQSLQAELQRLDNNNNHNLTQQTNLTLTHTAAAARPQEKLPRAIEGMLADLFEAILGAIFLDAEEEGQRKIGGGEGKGIGTEPGSVLGKGQGLAAVSSFLFRHFDQEIAQLAAADSSRDDKQKAMAAWLLPLETAAEDDWKSRLNTLVQRSGLVDLPRYVIVASEGPEEAKRHRWGVYLGQELLGESDLLHQDRRQAHRLAAQRAFLRLQERLSAAKEKGNKTKKDKQT